MHPFSTPWKQNRKVCWCFQGVEKGCIGNKRVDNAVGMTSRDILNKLIQLKLFIMEHNKNCKVAISQPTRM